MDKKITILELQSNLDYAGGSRNMVTFAKYLDKRFFDVVVCGYRQGGVMEEKLFNLGIPYIVGDGTLEKIVNAIGSRTIDVVHIHRSGQYIPLESRIIEWVRKKNSSVILLEKNVFGKHDHVSGKYFNCHMFQSMMHVHERYLKSTGFNFDFDSMKVMYNMVDTKECETFRVDSSVVMRYRQKLGITEGDFVIGKIARAHVAKWSDLILDMMPYLVRLVPSVKFIIIGVPESRKKRIQRSFYKDHIVILDPIEDEREVHLFYQSIDVLAHSSKIGECNGNTINEAMYWGKPVVVNSTPRKDNGQLEQINHLEDGIVANHPQTFARALVYLYKNQKQAKKMGEMAHKKILQNNSPEKIVRQLEKICFEKLQEKENVLPLSMPDLYTNVEYIPSKSDIVTYNQEYQKRLTQEFGKLSFFEKVYNLCKFPKKLYWKIRDFLEHRLGW